MRKNVFDTSPLIILGIAVLYWILKDHTVGGISAALITAGIVFVIIWHMRTIFDTTTGEISCGKLFRHKFHVLEITSAVIHQYPRGQVLELSTTSHGKYYIWRRCRNMYDFENYLQSQGIVLTQA